MGYKWLLGAMMMKVAIYSYWYSSITKVGQKSHVVDENRTITYMLDNQCSRAILNGVEVLKAGKKMLNGAMNSHKIKITKRQIRYS